LIYRIAKHLSLKKNYLSKERNQTDILPHCCRNLSKCINVYKKLEETNKMIILMTLDGLEYQEISEVIGITEETLRVRIAESKA
jgi:RNA polymerase sigma-70 factor (ECF subfamily)